MISTEQPKLTKARVERICQNSSTWHIGFGRIIQRGEQYLRVKAGGLSDFGVCVECVAREQASVEPQNLKSE
jgi:hypothetical protein